MLSFVLIGSWLSLVIVRVFLNFRTPQRRAYRTFILLVFQAFVHITLSVKHSQGTVFVTVNDLHPLDSLMLHGRTDNSKPLIDPFMDIARQLAEQKSQVNNYFTKQKVAT